MKTVEFQVIKNEKKKSNSKLKIDANEKNTFFVVFLSSYLPHSSIKIERNFKNSFLPLPVASSLHFPVHHQILNFPPSLVSPSARQNIFDKNMQWR